MYEGIAVDSCSHHELAIVQKSFRLATLRRSVFTPNASAKRR